MVSEKETARYIQSTLSAAPCRTPAERIERGSEGWMGRRGRVSNSGLARQGAGVGCGCGCPV
ncbi:hypothetical protein LIA77_09124 [Sarocladium implicatum]|nr:hypothetical protein LIA77_09124 [Sarocladium implicatum]